MYDIIMYLLDDITRYLEEVHQNATPLHSTVVINMLATRWAYFPRPSKTGTNYPTNLLNVFTVAI